MNNNEYNYSLMIAHLFCFNNVLFLITRQSPEILTYFAVYFRSLNFLRSPLSTTQVFELYKTLKTYESKLVVDVGVVLPAYSCDIAIMGRRIASLGIDTNNIRIMCGYKSSKKS